MKSVRRPTCFPVACVLVGLLALASAGGAVAQDRRGGGQERSFFRSPAPRPDKTIFSPLDLPTPTRERLANGAPGPEYWQQRVDYVIEASLDDEKNVITGRERIHYVNNSPVALDYLWMELSQNIVKPESKAARLGGRGRRSIRGEKGGGFDISSVTSGGKPLEFHVYATLARVELPRPIPANGGTFDFEISFSFPITNTVGRMGIRKGSQGPVYELAHWFPNVCVFDDVHGWNALPFMGSGEFYTNFGDYDVKLTVPRDHIVAATGVLQNPREVLTRKQLSRLNKARKSKETVVIRGADEVEDPNSRPSGRGPLTWHFKAEDVRTFAWASSKAFIWDACHLGGVGPDGRGTLVQSVYPREALPLWSKSTQMLRFAIEGYSKQWFKYPYPVATNVNGIAGGMEYPMIIFCSARGGRGGKNLERAERALFGVTTHEIGHNWFPMVVNTDERRHAWMDEGFNTFINYYSEKAYWGEKAGGRRTSARGITRFMKTANQLPIETPPDKMGGRLLGMLAYAKPAVGLRILREEILGPERFDPAFRAYIERWAFKSPRPADFFRCMEDAAGADLSWFWRGWFLETGALDQAVAEVKPGRGGDTLRVTFANNDRLVMPLVFEVVYDDGTKERRRLPVEAWAATNRFTTRLRTGEKKVVKIVVDPDGVFPDVNPDNNVWEADS